MRRRKMTNTTTRRYPFLYEMNHENHTRYRPCTQKEPRRRRHADGRRAGNAELTDAVLGAPRTTVPLPPLPSTRPRPEAGCRTKARGRQDGEASGRHQPAQGQRPWPPAARGPVRGFLSLLRCVVSSEKCLHQFIIRPPLVRLYIITMPVAPK